MCFLLDGRFCIRILTFAFNEIICNDSFACENFNIKHCSISWYLMDKNMKVHIRREKKNIFI